MFIWGALLIPIIVSVLGLIFFRKQVVWWEIILIIALSIGVILGVQGCYRVSVQQEPEYWGRYVTAVQYYEPWHEYEHLTCVETYQCGTDSKGNAIYCTRTYDCSHHTYHGPSWQAIDNYNEEYSISKLEYERLVKQFGTRPYFVELHREKYHDLDHCSSDYDGDMYQCNFDGDINRMQSFTTQNKYTNKVIHSKTVFNYPDVPDTLAFLFPKLPPLPERGGFFTNTFEYGYQWNADAIRGHKIPNFDNANHMLMKYNGLLGKSKEVRMQIILYHNAPIQYGEQLEWYWKGGNMNEFNLIVSVSDSMTVQWARVISWTEVQDLKVDVRNFVYEQKTFDIMRTVLYMGQNVEQRWVRKNFDTDFAYLDIDIPTWLDILIYVMVFLVSGGLGLFAVLNDINNDGQASYYDSWYYDSPIQKMKKMYQQNRTK
jgi:hypothetical protein